jgi:hypothetical protein
LMPGADMLAGTTSCSGKNVTEVSLRVVFHC